jgi:Family of unknown function (DUF6962)
MFNFYEQPSIEVFNIRVDEPVVMLTDLMVSVICFYAFFQLNRIPVHNKVQLYLKYYFLSMGFATAIGGIVGHGFLYLFNFYFKLPGWLTSMFSIALVERAAIEYARNIINPKIGSFFAWLNVIELLIFMTITFSTLNFFFVEVHTAYGLLVVVSSFSLFVYVKTKRKGSKLFLYAVGVSAISAVFFMNEWGISPWFNHFDISHTLLAVSAFIFYRGAREIIQDPIANLSNNISKKM